MSLRKNLHLQILVALALVVAILLGPFISVWISLVAIKHTEAGIAQLKERLPFADLSKFETNPVVQDFGNLLTVADMCRFIETKVEVTD